MSKNSTKQRSSGGLSRREFMKASAAVVAIGPLCLAAAPKKQTLNDFVGPKKGNGKTARDPAQPAA